MVATDTPHIHVVADGSAVRVTGEVQRELGHRLAETVHGPDGVFASWKLDGERLTVETDRYGMYPLFVHVGRNEIVVSPSIVKLLELGVPRDLDLEALCVFLHIGFFLREETAFRAIHALPPGARIEWTRGATRMTGAPFFAKPVEVDRDSAVEGYIELFRRAMRRRPPKGRTAVPLSGGRDSRHILFELIAAGRKPEVCVTAHYFPPRPDEDVAVAPRVAAAVGVRHVSLPQANELETEMQKNFSTGFCSDEHTWYGAVAEYLGRGLDTVYDGIGGDVLSSGLYLTPDRLESEEHGRYRELADVFLKPRYAATLSKLLARELRPALSRERARERVAAELAMHAEAPNPIGSFCFWNRTRREIALAPYGMGPATAVVYAPYLDHDLYDFLAGLPARMLVDRSFHTDAIQRAFSEHAAIAFERRRIKRTSARPYDRRFAKALLRSIWAQHDSLPGLLLARDFERRLRWLSATDAVRPDHGRIQPRLALYLRQLEAAVDGTLRSSLHSAG